MFGLPPGNHLREAVVVLTRDHDRTVDGNTGTEPALLRLLEAAIKADTSGAGGGPGRNKNSAPLDVTALSLWEEIAGVVGTYWPGRGDPKHKNQHLIDRLTWWTNTVAGTEYEIHLAEFGTYWVRQIRDLLDPPKIVELRGTACPNCKESWIRELQELETTFRPSVTINMSEDPVRLECRACGHLVFGFDMIKETAE